MEHYMKNDIWVPCCAAIAAAYFVVSRVTPYVSHTPLPFTRSPYTHFLYLITSSTCIIFPINPQRILHTISHILSPKGYSCTSLTDPHTSLVASLVRGYINPLFPSCRWSIQFGLLQYTVLCLATRLQSILQKHFLVYSPNSSILNEKHLSVLKTTLKNKFNSQQHQRKQN